MIKNIKASKKEFNSNTEERNLNLILDSNSYKLAQEDINFLRSDEMRGVRMLLEITKPELILEEENIISTIIVFGGAKILEESLVQNEIDEVKNSLEKFPESIELKSKFKKLKNLISMCHYYESAKEFSKLASVNNQDEKCNSHVIVTGGGPGIMEAANRGAFEVNCKSIGLNIDLPNEQFPNSFITPGLCFKFNYFALRKIHFVMRSVAAVFFPGGFGTLDELFELLTLRQTGIKSDIPIILFGRKYWENLINFKFLADFGLISEDDLKIFKYVNTASEAWEIVKSSQESKF